MVFCVTRSAFNRIITLIKENPVLQGKNVDKQSNRLGHFEFKTLRSPTVVRLGIGERVLQVKNPCKNLTASGYAGGPTIFLRCRLRERKSREILSLKDNFARLSKYAVPQEYPAKRRVQASDPEDTALATFCVATGRSRYFLPE